MMYGLGSSMGGCGVPSDRDRFYVADPTSGRSQFLGASGSRQTGYWYSPSGCHTPKPASTGYYDGAGRYHER
jgi:hypothetical protein